MAGHQKNIGYVAYLIVLLYGFYGQNDQRISATIGTTQKTMKRLGRIYQPVIYGDVGRAFLRRGFGTETSEKEKEVNQAAWSRLLSLLSAGQIKN